jgi:Predicted pyridoxal phosphate-dependent enzyme apparently involved in regulation of cell wall biogenesis
MIPVTKPFLPPIDEYQHLLQGIWQRNWLTNNGPLVNELELQLKNKLDVQHLLFVTNGTIALQIAIKALDLKGEIITTPFSYVATTSSIVWEGCKPVFADIDPNSLNIDPHQIEPLITDKTSAILATHVYGNPCDIEAIEGIARRYNLKVIYDGAHGFGTRYKGKSLFEFGDVVTTSFHSTKLFHTIEGGAVFTKEAAVLRRMALMRNFGHDGPEKFSDIGINGKNSEFHAAMGIVNLKYIDAIIARRREICHRYDEKLRNFRAGRVSIGAEVDYNFAYYPLIVEDVQLMTRVLEQLNRAEIFPRRYFYPCLSELPYVEGQEKLPVSKDISERILCLPLYHELSFEEVDMICRIMLRAQNYES